MGKHRSFVVSDFSLRDMPYFLVGYLVSCVICVLIGIAVETLPLFLRGLLCGIAVGLAVALALLSPRKAVDIASLPEPSAAVRAKLDDPNCSLVEVVKLYRSETGLGLTEATAVLKVYLAEGRIRDLHNPE